MFDWDSANVDHIARHRVVPEEAEQVVENEPLEIERQLRNGEERTLYLGETDAGRILLVVVTKRGIKLRVVTAHDANRDTRSFYFAHKDPT